MSLMHHPSRDPLGPMDSRRKRTTSAALSSPATFLVTLEDLASLHASKDPNKLYALGGLSGLEKALHTNRHHGLQRDDHAAVTTPAETRPGHSETISLAPPVTGPEDKFIPLVPLEDSGYGHGISLHERRRLFGDNSLPTRKQPTFLKIVWMTYNDPVLFLLTAAAIVSLAIGLYQALGTTHAPGEPSVEWVEGVAIIVAVVIIVLVGSVNDWEKLRQFKKLNQKQLQRDVKVVRSGAPRLIPISEVLVGDVVSLEPGDVIPADGVLIKGYNIVCDESIATGESGGIHKRPADAEFHSIPEHEDPDESTSSGPGLDPFILSGTQVKEGVGSFLVTATGINSMYGKILASIEDDPEPTPLQERLTVLAKYIAQSGGLVAVLLFVALMIRFFASLPHSGQTPSEKGKTFIDILIISLTVLVIAVPEGLPLAVTLSLAFATTKMLKDNNLVRRLKACEIMGNASSICSDKTGTLTQNNMVVVAGTVGASVQFREPDLGAAAFTAGGDHVETKAEEVRSAISQLTPAVRALLVQSVAVNTTAFEQEGNSPFIGSDTECALLTFARGHLGMGPVQTERSKHEVTQVIPFSALRQYMATVIALPGSKNSFRVFVKGAPEVLLVKCSKVLENNGSIVASSDLDPVTRAVLNERIQDYASRSLRTLALAYRDVDLQPSLHGEKSSAPTDFTLDHLLQDLVIVGIVGMHDPLRPGVPSAVATCQNAGITVRMVTGDNLQTARAIARQCGILSSDEDVVMEGARFRTLSDDEVDQILPRLRVLARSSPDDKRRLVIRLKAQGEIVAVTGDGTNDASALSSADVGFSMGGVSGTEVAREASDIILMNDDFTCVVKAVMWGRAVNDSVKKFLQFQITITVTSVLLTFVSAIANSNEQSVLTAVQLMWVNLFQDTMAALALATDPPQPRVLQRRPEPKSAPLITTAMWKTIIGQSLYQLAVTLVLYFAGGRIPNVTTDPESSQLKTLVFNTYVWMQVFNMYNNRQYDNSLNIFEAVLRNWLFIAISSIMIGVQILIIFVGGSAFSVVPLTGPQWAISLVLGLLSIPIGAVIRLLPDQPFERAAGRLVHLFMSWMPNRRRRDPEIPSDT